MHHKNWFRESPRREVWLSRFPLRQAAVSFSTMFPHSLNGDNKTYYLQVLLWKVSEIKGSKAPLLDCGRSFSSPRHSVPDPRPACIAGSVAWSTDDCFALLSLLCFLSPHPPDALPLSSPGASTQPTPPVKEPLWGRKGTQV